MHDHNHILFKWNFSLKYSNLG